MLPTYSLRSFGRDDVDLRAGQERFDADVDGEAALDDGLDLAADQAAVLEDLDDLVPVLLVGGFFLREDDHALVVFEVFEEHFDFVADFDFPRLRIRWTGWRLRICSRCRRALPAAEFPESPLDNDAFSEVGHRLRHHILHLQHKR